MASKRKFEKDSTLTVDELHSIAHYDPKTGIWSRIKSGKRLGGLHKRHGYRIIQINLVSYRSSRLAWFYMMGEWPPVQVDHINTIRYDDRWNNLRLATGSNNGGNRNLNKNSTTGIKGVWYDKINKKYHAKIQYQRRRIYLGLFPTKKEVAIAYRDAAMKYHRQFARTLPSPRKVQF